MSKGYYFSFPDPSGLRWENEDAKRTFYQSILNEDEWVLYNLLLEFRFNKQDVMDQALMLNQFLVSYSEKTHEQLLTLIEKTEPALFRTLRLPLVTGAFLNKEANDYTDDFGNSLDVFIRTKQAALITKITNAIQEKLLPLNTSWKQA